MKDDTKPAQDDDNSTNADRTETLVNEWMIRPCEVYDDEYRECTSMKARFHQYFIFGKTIDCNHWKRDSDNCYRWTKNRDIKSANELIESEKSRRKARLEAHYNNDVWERRKQPPENWSQPLPEYLQKEYEKSYLNIKAKEIKGELPPQPDLEIGYCSLM